VGDYVKHRPRRIIRKRVGPIRIWEKAPEVNSRKVYLANDEASRSILSKCYTNKLFQTLTKRKQVI
jgi:hypothetical protein